MAYPDGLMVIVLQLVFVLVALAGVWLLLGTAWSMIIGGAFGTALLQWRSTPASPPQGGRGLTDPRPRG